MINFLTVVSFLVSLTLFAGSESAGPRLSALPPSWPTATANQTSRPRPTAFPTPTVNVAPYLHKQGGKTVRIAIGKGEDVGVRVNDAEKALGASAGKIVITGGGSIRTQVVVSHDLEFQGEYTCDTQDVWHGCLLLKDDVAVSGGVIYGPTFQSGLHPAIFVFQNYNATVAPGTVGNVSKNITIKGVKVIGRQTKSDGGVRQTISLGNCHNCAVIDCTLENSAGIGIQLGGTAALGNHAQNSIVTGNTITGAGAAAIAVVNGISIYVWNNTVLRPGKIGWPGGVSCVDIETNAPADWAENLWVFNNVCDYTGAAFSGVGSALLAQQRGSARSRGLRIVNNRIWSKYPLNGLTSGVFIMGPFPGGIVANNLIEKTGMSGMQLHGSEGLTVESNLMVNVGGGGNAPAIHVIGGGRNIFRRNNMLYEESVGGHASAEVWESNSVGNHYDTAVIKK
jgi:hypothetical protein